MKKLTHYPRALLLLLTLSFPAYALDNTSICNMIIYSRNFNQFLALREFFQLYPDFVANFNPADETYCFNLRNNFANFPRNYYSPDQLSEFYDNCLNMSEQQIGFEYESFIRVQAVIQSCRLY